MRVTTDEFTSLVKTEEDAQRVITDLLLRFASLAAYDRLNEEATVQHKSTEEIARRTANNLLRSFKARRDRWS